MKSRLWSTDSIQHGLDFPNSVGKVFVHVKMQMGRKNPWIKWPRWLDKARLAGCVVEIEWTKKLFTILLWKSILPGEDLNCREERFSRWSTAHYSKETHTVEWFSLDYNHDCGDRHNDCKCFPRFNIEDPKRVASKASSSRSTVARRKSRNTIKMVSSVSCLGRQH